MWDRKVLKARGKNAFRANYWMSVLMALILLAVSGGGIGAIAGSTGSSININLNQDDVSTVDSLNLNEVISGFSEGSAAAFKEFGDAVKTQMASGAAAAILVIIAVVVVIAGVASLLLSILLFNPVQVGCQSFFIKNSAGQGAMSNIGRGFKPNWRGNVKTMFLRDLFLFLWGLLFIVPAIIKSYSYRMVPYILADHPELSGTEVITMSRQMMNGSKWRTFVLDLSFIGWHILSGLTLGILGIFYVAPYKCSTDAELYEALKNQFQI